MLHGVTVIGKLTLSVPPGYRETHIKIVLHGATGIRKLTLSVTPG